MGAYAAMEYYSGKNERYRIRLNATVVNAFRDVEYFSVLKSKDYIVLRPEKVMDEGRLRFIKYASKGHVSANNMVQNGFLPRHLFEERKKFKVKKTRSGDIYICLNEEVTKSDH